MGDKEDFITLQVYRSTGEKDEITMAMAQTLFDLKNTIALSAKLGSVPAGNQRVFYLGRELKSLNRSLSKLLGRQHGVNVIHFMAIHSSVQKKQDEGKEDSQKEKKTSEALVATNEQLDDDDDNDNEEVVLVENKPAVMIDLADDDESDDEEVEVVAQPLPKRRRRS